LIHALFFFEIVFIPLKALHILSYILVKKYKKMNLIRENKKYVSIYSYRCENHSSLFGGMKYK